MEWFAEIRNTVKRVRSKSLFCESQLFVLLLSTGSCPQQIRLPQNSSLHRIFFDCDMMLKVRRKSDGKRHKDQPPPRDLKPV